LRGRETSGREIRGGSSKNRAHEEAPAKGQVHPSDVSEEEKHSISRLQDELQAANDRADDAWRRLDLVEREKLEIEAELDSVIGSTGWKCLKQFRKLKSRFLPPGTYLRQLYDRAMIRFSSTTPASPRLGGESSAGVESFSNAIDTSSSEFSASAQLRESEPPSCSIIIPVRNRAVFTKACLLAIEKSVCAERIRYEVIVVDNGSTDDTPVLLTAWVRSRTNARILRMQQNCGFAHACNQGARMARGRYIVLLNNDTLPTPGWLEKMVELAQGDGQIGIVGSRLLFPDGRIQHIGVAFDEAKNPGHIYRGFPCNIPPANFSREYQAVTAACLLIERELYWAVGGLDEDYHNSYEDIDLCLKVRARGARVLVCADATVYHFESISDDRRSHDFRNRALLKNRWSNQIRPDLKGWYARDGISEEATQFESHGGYDPGQEKWLKDLWRRVYVEPFPEEEFNSIVYGLESH
jgi:GT2 family glycosyltransferase